MIMPYYGLGMNDFYHRQFGGVEKEKREIHWALYNEISVFTDKRNRVSAWEEIYS